MIDLAGIKRLIPHRHPMLLIDQVVAASPASVLAVKAITASEPWFSALPDDADHTYPWSLVLESWCQAAGVLVCLSRPNADVLEGCVPLFGAVSGACFLRPVLPGELLWHRARLLRATAGAAVVTGECSSRGETVLRVERAVVAFRPANKVEEIQHGS